MVLVLTAASGERVIRTVQAVAFLIAQTLVVNAREALITHEWSVIRARFVGCGEQMLTVRAEEN